MTIPPVHVEQILVDFNSKTQFFAIDKSDTKEPKFVVLHRKDFSCWQFFLKIIFGCGKLRKFDIRLTKVTHFLSRFDFSEISQSAATQTADTNSPGYKAYITACSLANKAINKRCYALFDKVSVVTTMKAFVKTYDNESDMFRKLDGIVSNETINAPWNPKITTVVLEHTVARANRFADPDTYLHQSLPHLNYSKMTTVETAIASCLRLVKPKPKGIVPQPGILPPGRDRSLAVAHLSQ